MKYLTILLASLVCFASEKASAEPSKQVDGEILVVLRNDADANGLGIGKVAGKQEKLKVARIKLKSGLTVEAAIAAMQKHPGVEFAEPNYIRQKSATPNDANYYQQYAPIKAQADKAWDIWQPKAKAVVAIVDTGVQYSHPDLQNVLLRDAANMVVGFNALTGQLNANDDEGHGTHCAGIAAGQINNGIGIAGVAGWNPNVAGSGSWVKVMPVKVLDAYGYGDDASIADGIVWAADKGANVISLSLGGPDWSSTLNVAVQYAWNRGAVVVAAAGNGGISDIEYPSGCDNVISVAATDSMDTLTYFSQYGSWVDVAAPGAAIRSTYLNSGYITMSGTSMATPFVAGEAALLKAHNPALTNSQLSSLITSSVDACYPYNGRTIAGGRVNVLEALQSATPQSYSLTASPTTSAPGGSLTVSWTAPVGRPAGDWIALYKLGADNHQYSWWKYTGGAASGSFSLNAPAEAGSYEFRYLLNNGYSDAARSAAVKVEVPATTTYSLTAAPSSVSAGGTISIAWTAPAGRPVNDWIGLYKVGAAGSAFGWWKYTGGAGTGSFNVPAPSASGQYEFRYLLNNGFSESARSNVVTVGSGGGSTYSLTAGAASVKVGAPLSVSWAAPAGTSVKDWIGLFRTGGSSAAYVWWSYTNGSASGTANLTAPSQTGTYEFRYFLNDGSTEAARSGTVTVNP